LDRALEIYETIYGNAENFTFIFTGDFSEKEVLSLCRKYLGNLPVVEAQKNCATKKVSKKHSLPKPRKIFMQSTEHMQEVMVQLGYISGIDASTPAWKKEAKLKLLQSLLNFSILQKMRFNYIKEGGSYDTRVFSNQSSGLFTEVSIYFGCSPEDADQLIKEVKQCVVDFKNSFVDKELLERYKNYEVLSLEKDKANKYSISDKMYDYYKLGKQLHSIEEEQEYIKSISQADIKDMVQRLTKEEPFEFRMVPKQLSN